MPNGGPHHVEDELAELQGAFSTQRRLLKMALDTLIEMVPIESIPRGLHEALELRRKHLINEQQKQIEREKREIAREQGLSKLTPEERAALGLR